jgi:hypothetical protein
LPVRRPNASDRNIVVAVPAELDVWIKQRLQPRKTVPLQHCSEQLERMHKLVHVMVQETQRTVDKTAELLKKFDRKGRRLPTLELQTKEEVSSGSRTPMVHNVN